MTLQGYSSHVLLHKALLFTTHGATLLNDLVATAVHITTKASWFCYLLEANEKWEEYVRIVKKPQETSLDTGILRMCMCDYCTTELWMCINAETYPHHTICNLVTIIHSMYMYVTAPADTPFLSHHTSVISQPPANYFLFIRNHLHIIQLWQKIWKIWDAIQSAEHF